MLIGEWKYYFDINEIKTMDRLKKNWLNVKYRWILLHERNTELKKFCEKVIELTK